MHGLLTLWSYHLNVLDKGKHLYSQLADISISNIYIVSDISIFSGIDNLMLHIYIDIGVGNENEPVAPKPKLGWVIFGDRQNTNNTVTYTRFPRNLIPKTLF